MSAEPAYPEPPWYTFGFGVMCPYWVRVRDLSLPLGLEPVGVAGRTLGLLGYIEYRPPSPLVYGELLWMPATVRFRARDGKVTQGYYVARMYVDHPGSLAAGRELWALPKTLATFERRPGGVDVSADDGTRLSFEHRGVGPAFWLKSRVATLQVQGEGVVRFRSDFAGLVRPARTRIAGFSSEHQAWAAFPRARGALGLGSMFERFESTMRAPLAMR
ncbi:MAG: acetoacetate decarboxylase family protein [Myxococcales bacterium]|nr:acetoacetate decarboxylase family protein [Myxococcales bacterium]